MQIFFTTAVALVFATIAYLGFKGRWGAIFAAAQAAPEQGIAPVAGAIGGALSQGASTVSQAVRDQLARSVDVMNQIASQDLTDPSKTNTDLIATLTAIVGRGYHLLLTAINSDHSDDSLLGPHSHKAGYAADVGAINGVDVGNNSMTAIFLKGLLDSPPPYLAKIGLGGGAQALYQPGVYNGVEVFYDNDQPHIHLQSN